MPPPAPSSPARSKLDDVLLDIDLAEDDDDEDLNPSPEPARAAGARPRRHSSSKSGPSDSGTVDVSGIIPEQTPPPEPIVPEPTVDASALGPAPLADGRSAHAAPPIDRGGAPGASRSGPVLGARGPATTPPPLGARSGTRTSPPPPPGARATGAAAAIPGGPAASSAASGGVPVVPASPAGAASGGVPRASAPGPASASGGVPRASASGAVPSISASGGVPRASASGAVPSISASGGVPRSSASGPASASGASDGVPRASARTPVSSITGRLPLPADPESTPWPAPAPSPPRAVRPALIFDESGTETVPEVGPARASGRLAAASSAAAARAAAASASLASASPAQREISTEWPGPLGVRDDDDDDTPEPLLVEGEGADGRGDPTTIDPSTHRFERADPTSDADVDPTVARIPGAGPGAAPAQARLRTIAQLRRRRGVGGDMRYVLTTIFGLRRARRELAGLEVQEAALQQSRRRHLMTLARTAVSAEGFAHPALGGARERLRAIEEERAGHTAKVAVDDAELQRVTRDRDAKARQHAADLEAVDAELADLGKALEPLEKEIAGVTRRAADLRDSMRRVDGKIALAEASLAAAEPEQRAALQAELASLRADRKAVQKDEPALAGALDSLHPRIAKLEAARADARKRRAELEQAERDDQRRTEELLAAIGARRKVVDRAAADAEAARDKILFELGDRIYVDRPESMAPELSPIDAIDVELGTVERRTMELREILQSVDRWKLARGVALWILLVAALGAIIALALGVKPPL
jgi:prefoldin subunit 5